MSQNKQQSHTERRWLKHAFLSFKGFIFYLEKDREEGRQNSMINGTNQASQKIQRGEWGYANLYTMDDK